MTSEVGFWILGILVAVLGFIAAWQFNKIIHLGERITAHDIEILNLRAQQEKTEGTVASAINKLEASLNGFGHSIETKVGALHQRLDRIMHNYHNHGNGSNEN